MAIYRLQVSVVSRRTGGRATRAAAYRAGERIRDERTGELYNRWKRNDVVHKEIVLPSRFAGDTEMVWARDRARLWNAAEDTDRCNARVAREVFVVLPSELTAMQRAHLACGFARELADRYQSAVDVAIHLPRPYSDERSHHAHLLMTTRQVTPQGLGARTILELSGTELRACGLGPSKAELVLIRQRWAHVANEALRRAGFTPHLDHRSLEARGINREPVPRIPARILYMERASGIASPAGDDIRRRHRERVEARLKGSDELARVVQRQKEEGRRRVMDARKQKEQLAGDLPLSALNKEELAERRRMRYQVDRERINQNRRARYQANAQVMRQKQREARRLARPTPEQQAVQRWLKWRAKQQEQAQQLVQGKRRGPAPSLTAEDSVRNWLAFRERQKQAESSRNATQGRSRDHALGRHVHEADDINRQKKIDRSLDYDYGL